MIFRFLYQRFYTFSFVVLSHSYVMFFFFITSWNQELYTRDDYEFSFHAEWQCSADVCIYGTIKMQV